MTTALDEIEALRSKVIAEYQTDGKWNHDTPPYVPELLSLLLNLGEKPLNPDMSTQELRLHMGELTANEVRVARAAIRWANSRLRIKCDTLVDVSTIQAALGYVSSLEPGSVVTHGWIRRWNEYYVPLLQSLLADPDSDLPPMRLPEKPVDMSKSWLHLASRCPKTPLDSRLPEGCDIEVERKVREAISLLTCGHAEIGNLTHNVMAAIRPYLRGKESEAAEHTVNYWDIGDGLPIGKEKV